MAFSLIITYTIVHFVLLKCLCALYDHTFFVRNIKFLPNAIKRYKILYGIINYKSLLISQQIYARSLIITCNIYGQYISLSRATDLQLSSQNSCTVCARAKCYTVLYTYIPYIPYYSYILAIQWP